MTDRSKEEENYVPNEECFFNNECIPKESMNLNDIERYELNEERLSEENAYLREMMENMMSTIQHYETENSMYKSELEESFHEIDHLRHKVSLRILTRDNSSEL